MLDILKHIVQAEPRPYFAHNDANDERNMIQLNHDRNMNVVTQDQENTNYAGSDFGSKHCEFLLHCQSFKDLMIRMMYRKEIEVVEFKESVIEILRGLIQMQEFVNELFIKKGLVMFMLNLIFEQSNNKNIITKETRGRLIDQVLKIEHAVMTESPDNFMYQPTH